MGEFGFLQDLVVVMVVAAVATIGAYRLKQPVVLGYLLAGVVIGPLTPPFSLVADLGNIHALADFGIIFLMFALGLEFNLRKLRKIGGGAALSAAINIGGMLLLGYGTGRYLLGWSMMDAIFLGAIVSISSTVIIVKVLMEQGRMSEGFATAVFGILIIEDLAAVVLVALLESLATAGTLSGVLAAGVLLNVGVFIAVSLAVGLVLVPRLIDWVSRFHVEEVLVTTVVGLSLGYALVAVKLGFSMALGAFIMGAIIAESRAVERVEHKITPLRDMFTAVFFVAVGMLIDVRVLWNHGGAVLLITAVAILGKILTNFIGGIIAGTRPSDAGRTGFTLAVIGEFSFIIAAMGASLGVISDFLYPVAVAVCVLTSFVNPYLVRGGEGIIRRFTRTIPEAVRDATHGYQARVRKLLRRAPAFEADGRGTRTRVLIYACWLLGLLLAAAGASAWVTREVDVGAWTAGAGWVSNAERTAALGFVVLAGLPLFYAFTKSVESLARVRANRHAMAPHVMASNDAILKAPRIVARVAAMVAAVGLLVAAFALAWDAHPFALPEVAWLVPAAIILSGAAYLSWGQMGRAYQGMERALDALWAPADAMPSRALNRIKERYPWGMDVMEHQVHPGSATAYVTLKDLRLRERSGATILSIERGSSTMVNPNPHMALLPGDKLYLVGRGDQLARARNSLTGRHEPSAPSPTLTQEEVRLPPSSPQVGRTMAEARVETTTGARIASIRRADGGHVATAPHTRFQAGDQIVLHGERDAIERAVDHLRARDPRNRAVHPYFSGPVGVSAGLRRQS